MAFFYAVRELKRRWIHFTGLFFMLGTALFIPLTLYGITEAENGNGWNEQLIFFFGVMVLITFLMSVMSFCDKYDKFSRDYRALVRLGMPKRKLILIQIVEMTAVFMAAVLVFVPVSYFMIRMLVSSYNSRLYDMPWIFEERFSSFELPELLTFHGFDSGFIGLFAFLYITLLLSVCAAYFRYGREHEAAAEIRSKDGTLYGEEKFDGKCDFRAYASAVSGRLRKKLRHTGKTAVLSFLVPAVMLCGAFTSGEVHHSGDVFVMTDDVKNPIPNAVYETIAGMDGIESIDCSYHDRADGERVIHHIRIDLEKEAFYETALRIASVGGIGAFEVRFNCFSELFTNADYRMNREYFLLSAAFSFVSGLVSLAFLMNECVVLRQEEMRVLQRFGVDQKRRIMLKSIGSLTLYLPAVLLTGVGGIAAYAVLSLWGGDRPDLGDIAMTAGVMLVFIAITSALSVVTAAISEKTDRME